MLWNPWRGCHRIREGCRFCYIHKGDKKRGIDTNIIAKTDDFDKPIQKNKKGEYKIKSGTVVYLGFKTDFLLEEADDWRLSCYEMMKERSDLSFLFLTKRIERFLTVLPEDWGEGYPNLTVGVSIENQENADRFLPVFNQLPIRHKNINCQPLLEKINIEPYLDHIDAVIVGGESDKEARYLHYDWVLDIKEQCLRKKVTFIFRQCGTHFIRNGIKYTIPTKQLMNQAKRANIDHYFEKNENKSSLSDIENNQSL